MTPTKSVDGTIGKIVFFTHHRASLLIVLSLAFEALIPDSPYDEEVAFKDDEDEVAADLAAMAKPAAAKLAAAAKPAAAARPAAAAKLAAAVAKPAALEAKPTAPVIAAVVDAAAPLPPAAAASRPKCAPSIPRTRPPTQPKVGHSPHHLPAASSVTHSTLL